MTQENYASSKQEERFGTESARRMAVKFRLAVLALTFIEFFGLILHNVIPYTPTFPVAVLVNSLVAVAAGVQALRLLRGRRESGYYAVGLAYTALTGGIIMFIFSGISVVAGAVGSKGGIAGQHGSALLLGLSAPATVLSLAAIGLAVAGYRLRKSLAR